MKGVTPLKKSMTVEDVRARAARTVEQCILHGTTRMRTQVEVDPGIGMRGFEGVQSLIADYKWAIDIEICVFPQEGLINYPGTDELLVEGLKRGAKLIGGAPRYDTDEAGQIERIFELAREFDVDIDIHLDVGPTADDMNIHLVRELTEKYKRGGRVVVGHMAKLSLLPPAELAALARRLADAGIAVTVLPATDLFLMGRDQDHNVRRGVADANLLIEHGVNCSLSSNNILNPATPYGDCSLIRMANLYANILQVDRPAQLARMLSHADGPVGAAAQSPGLRIQARQPRRHRRHRRANPRAGGRRNLAADCDLQERQADGRLAFAEAAAAALGERVVDWALTDAAAARASLGIGKLMSQVPKTCTTQSPIGASTAAVIAEISASRSTGRSPGRPSRSAPAAATIAPSTGAFGPRIQTAASVCTSPTPPGRRNTGSERRPRIFMFARRAAWCRS